MRRLRLRIVRRASRQIEEAAEWWRANRPGGPNALEEELYQTLELIRSHPLLGPRWSKARRSDVRRMYLSRARYHIYYRLSDDGSTIEVLRFWHSSRGLGPQRL